MPAQKSCFVTNTDAVNFRSTENYPSTTNIIGQLYAGHECTSLDESGTWWRVKTEIENVPYEGFIHSHYLTHEMHVIGVVNGVPEAHLSHDKAHITLNGGSRAHPIGDPNRVLRDMTDQASKVASIHDIIDYLDVENSSRYSRPRHTFCNVYAHDFCYLCGVFLPRVWWNGSSLISLVNGNNVEPRYNDTVEEIMANEIFHWLRDFGPTFGWIRVFSAEDVQDAVNRGKIGVIVANTKNHGRSGHIAVAVPQTATHTPVKTEGRVTTPVMSQSGLTNKKYFSYKWWTSTKYSFFGYWIHE